MKFKNDIEKFEFFESVLNNNVSNSHKAKFEDALKDNKLLADEFYDYKKLHDLVIDDALLDVRETLNSIHSEVKSSNKTEVKRNPGKNFLFITISGVIVLSAILYLFVFKKSTDTLTKSDIPISFSANYDSMFVSQNMYEDKKKVANKNKEPLMLNHKIVQDSSAQTEISELQPHEGQPQANVIEEGAKTEEEKTSQNKEGISKLGISLGNVEPAQKPTEDLLKNSDEQKDEDVVDETVDCNKVEISCKYNFSNTCVESVSGEIQVDSKSLKGGTPPYFISINGGGEYFESRYLFGYLTSGTYELFIRDNNFCEKEIATIDIDEKICKTEYKYSPILDEPWLIPFEKDKNGIFRLLSKTGQVLVEKRIDIYTEKTWFGKDDEGNQLEMGYYPFVIQYSNGELFKGGLTLVK